MRLTYEDIARCNRLPKTLKKYLFGGVVDIDYAMNKHIVVGIGGRVKSGKSTLLNGLIGYEVLPDAPMAETAVLGIIEHDQSAVVPLCYPVEICLKPGLERSLIFLQPLEEPKASQISADDIREHPELLREAFDKIREELQRQNREAREGENVKSKEGASQRQQLKGYLIRYKLPTFGNEKVYLFDSPGIHDSEMSAIFENYYLSLLRTSDMWIEVVSAQGAPTDSAVTQQLREFFLNVFLTGRDKSTTTLALNKFDHPHTPQSEQYKKIWKTALENLSATLFTVETSNLVFVSGLNMLRYALYECHKRFRREEQQEIESELEGAEREYAEKQIQKKVTAWKTNSNGQELIARIQQQYEALERRLLNSKSMQERMLEVLEDYIHYNTEDVIKHDISVVDSEFAQIIQPVLSQAKTKIDEVKNKKNPTMEDVVRIGSELEKVNLNLAAACRLFAEVAVTEIYTKTAMQEHWNLVIHKVERVVETCQKIHTVSRNTGLFVMMFSAQGAILLANATYFLRLGGILSTTWWCVPLCAAFCLFDLVCTAYLLYKSSSNKEAASQDQPGKTWRDKILELESEYTNLQDYVLRPLKEMLAFAQLSGPEKERVLAELRDLQDRL